LIGIGESYKGADKTGENKESKKKDGSKKNDGAEIGVHWTEPVITLPEDETD